MKKITAHQCEHCGKVYENPASCRSHEYRCYYNPRTKSCASCAFFRQEEQPFDQETLFKYRACLVNVSMQKRGLQTQCPLYMDRKYADDPDIMRIVRKNYKAAEKT